MRGIKKVIVVAVAAASLFLTVNNDDDADDCWLDIVDDDNFYSKERKMCSNRFSFSYSDWLTEALKSSTPNKVLNSIEN